MPNLPPPCPNDGPRRKRDTRPSSAARGYGAAHRRRRAYMIQRQPICPCGQWSTDMHHADGNNQNNDEANLVMLCHACHSALTYESTRPRDTERQ